MRKKECVKLSRNIDLGIVCKHHTPHLPESCTFHVFLQVHIDLELPLSVWATGGAELLLEGEKDGGFLVLFKCMENVNSSLSQVMHALSHTICPSHWHRHRSMINRPVKWLVTIQVTVAFYMRYWTFFGVKNVL